ncbi:MAG: hypothetical protein AAGB46_00950 [Verrucomicrobiota bacterium]
MELTLFQATLIFGLATLVCGLALSLQTGAVSAMLKGFPRSKMAAYAILPVGLVWVLYEVTQLGPADFGNHKNLIFIGFLILGLGSFKFAPDFLSVRAVCILYLLITYKLVYAGYMQYEEPLRLVMVTPLYLGAALAIYLAYAPYRVRDFFEWFLPVASRVRLTGLIMALYGLAATGVAFAY